MIWTLITERKERKNILSLQIYQQHNVNNVSKSLILILNNKVTSTKKKYNENLLNIDKSSLIICQMKFFIKMEPPFGQFLLTGGFVIRSITGEDIISFISPCRQFHPPSSCSFALIKNQLMIVKTD